MDRFGPLQVDPEILDLGKEEDGAGRGINRGSSHSKRA